MPEGKRSEQRPYVGDAGRSVEGPVDAATVTIGFVLLALAAGFVIGFAVFCVMNLSTWLTDALWGPYLGGELAVPWFPLVVCVAGGLAIGLWTRFSGSRIQSLEEVMGEFKRTGAYHVGAAKGAVSFLLPLVFGGSIGFEAGLTGLITAGCCWIRDKLKAAGLREAAVADVTIAASLSAIFGTPLAGIVAGAESEPDAVEGGAGEGASSRPSVDEYDLRRSTKLVLYTAAAFGAFAGIAAFSNLFGGEMGFPRFGEIEAVGAGHLWAFAAIALGYALTLVYHGSRSLFAGASRRIGDGPAATVAKPVVAGVVLGALACAFPYVLFPGETQSHLLMETWTSWTAVALVATGLLKALVTPMCIEMGWVGGNFCPSIFAGAACGYGLAMATGADPALMVTATTTAYLAGVVRKPLLTIAVLLLCFPVDGIVWVGLAAVIGAALPLPKRLAGEEAGREAGER